MEYPAHLLKDTLIIRRFSESERTEKLQVWADSRKPKTGHQLMTVPSTTTHYIMWEDDLDLKGPEVYH